MSYKLNKPCSDIERADFIVKYNHQAGLQIEETDDAIFALLENEILKDGVPIVNENYQNELIEKRRANFEQEFFNTSLGWIRRKVNMKDGSQKDFLSDLLLQIKAGLELGQEVSVITYLQPDFSQNITEEYMVSRQERKLANADFIQECLVQTVKDFVGG